MYHECVLRIYVPHARLAGAPHEDTVLQPAQQWGRQPVPYALHQGAGAERDHGHYGQRAPGPTQLQPGASDDGHTPPPLIRTAHLGSKPREWPGCNV